MLAIDAKATEHILHRHGIGRLKHMDMAYLCTHEDVTSKRLKVRRVRSEENVADLGTKALSKAVISKHSITLGRGRFAVHSYRGVRAQVCLLGRLRRFLAAGAAAAGLEGVDLVRSFERDDLSDEPGSDECSSVHSSEPENSSEPDLFFAPCSTCAGTTSGTARPRCDHSPKEEWDTTWCETCRLLVCAVCFNDRLLKRMLTHARSSGIDAVACDFRGQRSN